MTQMLLDAQVHAGLRYLPAPLAEPHFVPLVVSEFVEAAAVCPILLTKDARDGSFYPGALLGLTPQQGALQDLAARGGFLPLHLQREGFFISGEHVVIDPDCPRFSREEGEALFDAQHRPSARLRHIQQVLGRLHAGQQRTQQWLQQLLALRLVEVIDTSFDLGGAGPLQLQGLYCISRDATEALEDAQVLPLFRDGSLALIHAMQVSLGRLQVLGELARQQRRVA